MNIPFSDPQLRRINKKLERIEREIESGKAFRDLSSTLGEMREMITARTLGSFIHNIYSGIEQVFEDIAVTLDGGRPTGASTHSALLEQMSVETAIRPALLSDAQLNVLDDIRRFRHLFRYNYGDELREPEVREKFEAIVDNVWPDLLASLESLRSHLDQDYPNGCTM